MKGSLIDRRNLHFDANAWNGHSTWHFIQDLSQRDVFNQLTWQQRSDGYMYPKASIQKYLGYFSCFEENEMQPFWSALIMHFIIQYIWRNVLLLFSWISTFTSLTWKVDIVAAWALNIFSSTSSQEHAMEKTCREAHLTKHPHCLRRSTY